MSWYTTYRPRSIAQLHSKSVRDQLSRLLTRSQFPHALLFAGPKGTGKTSSARILAALLNDPINSTAVQQMILNQSAGSSMVLVDCDPQAETMQLVQSGRFLAVTELDAASNRGIDDIRRLKETLYLPPQQGVVSLYILDEAHMLTTEAFNALLKILEEPPKHVVFVLATTEVHRIPGTIRSRCELIQFSLALEAEIEQALESVLTAEKIKVEAGGLAMIAQAAQGSFRDAVKLAEQLAAGQASLSLEFISEHLQTSRSDVFKNLLTALLNRNLSAVTDTFTKLRSQGADPQSVTKDWLGFLYEQLLASIAGKKTLASTQVFQYLLQAFLEIDSVPSPIPLLPVELKAYQLILKSQEKNARLDPPSSPPSQPHTPAQPHPKNKPPASVVTASSAQSTNEVVLSSLSSSETGTQSGDGSILVERWEEFLSQVANKNMGLELLLRSTRPIQGELGAATIEVFFDFHKQQLQSPKFFEQLMTCVKPIVGGDIKLEFITSHRAQGVADANLSLPENDELVALAKEVLV